MMKKILYLVIAIAVITSLTGCKQSRLIPSPEKVSEIEVEDLVKVTETEQNEQLCKWQLELTKEMFKELPDVPDWNSEEAYNMYLEGYKPSNEVLEFYKQKERNDELMGGYLNIYYEGTEVNYMPTWQEGMYANAMFKKDESIITIHQSDRKLMIGYPKGEPYEEIELDKLPKEYMLLTTVSIYEGSPDTNLNEGFSICYDLENSEAVCIRFGKEIGKRVKIPYKDIQEFMNREEEIESYPSLSIGYINSKNELVYPTIVEDSTGIRFELLKKALKEQKNSKIYFSSAIVSDINFKVYNNNAYIIDNVKRRVSFNVDKGYCYGIWTEKPEIEEIFINNSDLKDIEIELLSGYNKKEIEACATMGNITILGKDTYIYNGLFKNKKFQKYLFDEGVDGYVHADTLLSFEFDNWEEAESTIVKFKEAIRLAEEND